MLLDTDTVIVTVELDMTVTDVMVTKGSTDETGDETGKEAPADDSDDESLGLAPVGDDESEDKLEPGSKLDIDEPETVIDIPAEELGHMDETDDLRVDVTELVTLTVVTAINDKPVVDFPELVAIAVLKPCDDEGEAVVELELDLNTPEL